MSNPLNLFNTTLKLRTLSSGSCRQLEKFLRKNGKWRAIQIPALFTYIEHPTYGSILFDTGYSPHFYKATKRMPYAFYRYITPVSINEDNTASEQLKQIGVQSEAIQYIILSHFHADHIGALKEFPNAKFIYLQASYDMVKNRNRFSQTKAGFVPGLLPKDFVERSLPIDEERTVSLPISFPFKRGLDIMGDGSIIAVDLPGHAAGQIGILLATKDQKYFLCADGVWESNAFKKAIPPHWLTNVIVDNRYEARDTFARICTFHKNHPEFCIIPSHCREVWQSIGEGELYVD